MEAATLGGPKTATELTEAFDRSLDWFERNQAQDGYWCGELEGDSILQSEYILLLAWLRQENAPTALAAAETLLRQQRPQGGWALFPGGPVDVSASVKAYFALKLVGHDATSEPLERARQAIMASGGADRVNSFTRFYLALLGQISYDDCPAVPPEMVMLPRWGPVHIYRMSAWSRTILIPLSVMWAHRPLRQVPTEFGIAELFKSPPKQWPRLRCPRDQAKVSRWQAMSTSAWETFFHTVDAGIRCAERLRIRPLRALALQRARQWMLNRFPDSDGLGAIFPPIVWSIVALRCLGYADDSAEVRECRRQLDGLIIQESGRLRLQPCKSPVWDTALSMRAVSAMVGRRVRPQQPALQRASQWLLSKEVRCRGDWAQRVEAAPGGWFFEHRNAFYPDVDDTAMVIMALREAAETADAADDVSSVNHHAACQRGLQWILAMQNRDGGWGAFDRDNDCRFLCHVPFADHNAMIDPSTADITARVLEAICPMGLDIDRPEVSRAVRFLRSTQERDGSWIGRWGVNYIYGTWQVIAGLVAAGVRREDAAIQRAADWLLAVQQPEGGWGESPLSYSLPDQKGRGPLTASQTSWALLGLIDAGHAAAPAVRRAIRFLLETQQADGTWHEEPFTGTGFPLVFYLRYHLYPVYFPALALAKWSRAVESTP